MLSTISRRQSPDEENCLAKLQTIKEILEGPTFILIVESMMTLFCVIDFFSFSVLKLVFGGPTLPRLYGCAHVRMCRAI